MEILVEQRHGFQQLKDEVEAIRSEVVELRSRPVSPVQSPSSSDISDGAVVTCSTQTGA
jgi:hypothetical protein